jgi:hypothetical protein
MAEAFCVNFSRLFMINKIIPGLLEIARNEETTTDYLVYKDLLFSL